MPAHIGAGGGGQEQGGKGVAADLFLHNDRIMINECTRMHGEAMSSVRVPV